MFLIVKLVLLFTLVFGFNLSANATTPDEYCTIHKDSGAPGKCTPCGECAVLTTNLGTHEVKLCTDGGCELTDNASCPEFPACVGE